MSRTLERRTARLEAHHSNADEIALIIRRIVGCQVVRALIGDDVVDRRSDEAEYDFVERAKGEAVARTDRRPCRVLLLPQQVLQ